MVDTVTFYRMGRSKNDRQRLVGDPAWIDAIDDVLQGPWCKTGGLVQANDLVQREQIGRDRETLAGNPERVVVASTSTSR
ncbi:hypothetical protein D3C81_1231270 [compost metagenome]